VCSESSVSQYDAVYCSVLQCVAVYCSVLQCVAVCCNVLRSMLSVCCYILQYVLLTLSVYYKYRVLHRLSVCSECMLTLSCLCAPNVVYCIDSVCVLRHVVLSTDSVVSMCSECSVLHRLCLCALNMVYCSVVQCGAVSCSILHRVNYDILQHTATHCNTLQHTATHIIVAHRQS